MIYLDYAATTPVDTEVFNAMLPFFSEEFANASSVDHVLGSRARAAVERARLQVAQSVGAKPEEVIFTSGSTEANNIVLNTSLTVLTSAIEHPSILEPARARHPSQHILIIGVDANGIVSPEELSRSLEQLQSPVVVSIMAVNNETGTRQRISDLAAVAKQHGSFFHTDATQAILTERLDMSELLIDALSISGHKIYGPKGVGALVCKSGLRQHLVPLQLGGGHERGLRSGTLNVPGIVGFGEAVRLAQTMRDQRLLHLASLRKNFIETLKTLYNGHIEINGGADVSPHICSVRVVGVNNRALLRSTAAALCYSLGSACATNKAEPSHVLLALGQSKREANETIRLSFGINLTVEQVVEAATILAKSANELLRLVA
jgi:cysteine desulfurase